MAINHVTDPINDYVYRGIWINKNRGNTILGATLTLDRETGGILIAFLATYIVAAGKAFWNISRFLLHYYLSSAMQQDAIYHQQQAILRNTQNSFDALWISIKASAAWRKRTRRSFGRFSLAATVAFVAWTGFSVASLLSPRLTSNNANEVQLSSKACLNNTEAERNAFNRTSIVSDRSQAFLEHATYALRCYRDELAVNTTMCQNHPTPKLPYNMDSNANCPFSREICKSASGNIILDTGLLDSNAHLGINTNPKFQFRCKRHCAPLVTRGYSEIHTDPDSHAFRTARYFYGYSNSSSNGGTNNSYMFEIPLMPRNLINISDKSRRLALTYMNTGYKIRAAFTYPGDRTTFTPIQALDQSDGRLSILFMDAPETYHLNKVEDPWIYATKELNFTPSAPNPEKNASLFISDDVPQAIGCTTQVYVCNPQLFENQRCLSIFSVIDDNEVSEIWPKTEDRMAVLGAAGAPLGFFSMALEPELFYSTPGVPSTLAGLTLFGAVQADYLPADQWQKEMEYHFQVTLASIQNSMIDVMTGKAPWTPLGSESCKNEDNCRKICGYQRVKSTGFYSFSVLAIVIILVFGGILMLLAAFLDQILATLSHRYSRFVYPLLEWRSNSILQLQRSVHENLGLGTWSHASDDVPVTKQGETLGIIDTSDRKHPRLVNPASCTSDSNSEIGFETESDENIIMTSVTNRMYTPL
ncbi:hypothetical protein DM02DRAFT_673935 [Periconia macrospinosa]|uniref:Uncharacterized protein n=1 Tax=Periconia macrospinosa TaxID=97972 RepID=A0A2V1DI06_9PLEO|nr:hypothetical protein DM02DRAFT_673935 [Periconia macrospinosa]